MIIEWTVPVSVDFDERKISRLIHSAHVNGYDETLLTNQIHTEIGEFDDIAYYSWGPKQTQEVLAEVRRRLNPTG